MIMIKKYIYVLLLYFLNVFYASVSELFQCRRPPTAHVALDAQQRHDVAMLLTHALLLSEHPPLTTRGASKCFSEASNAAWRQGGL